jgi:hypothetical protein
MGETGKQMLPANDRRDFLRTSLGTLGFLALAGCGGGGGSGNAASDVYAAAASQVRTPLLTLSQASLAGIRAQPQSIVGVYGALGGSSTAAALVRSTLGAPFATLTDAGALAVYSSMVAFECAPLGTATLPPLTATMQQLLALQSMACGHFCKLATMLTLLGHPELIPPDAAAGSAPKPTLHFLVWWENVPLSTGVHSQLVLDNVLDDAYLLLDPTYAYALKVPFVGAGPQGGLTVIENAANMMATAIPKENLVILDPAGTATMPAMLQTLLGGHLGATYIYHDALYGSEGWDTQIAQLFDSLGGA